MSARQHAEPDAARAVGARASRQGCDRTARACRQSPHATAWRDRTDADFRLWRQRRHFPRRATPWISCRNSTADWSAKWSEMWIPIRAATSAATAGDSRLGGPWGEALAGAGNKCVLDRWRAPALRHRPIDPHSADYPTLGDGDSPPRPRIFSRSAANARFAQLPTGRPTVDRRSEKNAFSAIATHSQFC